MLYINNVDFVLTKDKNKMILKIVVKKDNIVMKIMIKLKSIVVIIKLKGLSVSEKEKT